MQSQNLMSNISQNSSFMTKFMMNIFRCQFEIDEDAYLFKNVLRYVSKNFEDYWSSISGLALEIGEKDI